MNVTVALRFCNLFLIYLLAINKQNITGEKKCHTTVAQLSHDKKNLALPGITQLNRNFFQAIPSHVIIKILNICDHFV